MERYIHSILRKQAIDYNEEFNSQKAAKYFHVENEYACFHIGIYTKRYKEIYVCFGRAFSYYNSTNSQIYDRIVAVAIRFNFYHNYIKIGIGCGILV